MTEQPNLFETPDKPTDAEKIALFALGEFQSRGKILADRELPLDRLRGAFKRAAEKFSSAELSDEEIAEILAKLGAKIKQVPPFVAKHPYRITVTQELANYAKNSFESSQLKDKSIVGEKL